MTEIDLINMLLSTIGLLVAVLVATIAWIGSRIHGRLDAISSTLVKIERDIGKDVSLLSERLTAIETVCTPACGIRSRVSNRGG